MSVFCNKIVTLLYHYRFAHRVSTLKVCQLFTTNLPLTLTTVKENSGICMSVGEWRSFST